MDKFDELIAKALTDEDRALLSRHGEPGYFAQALGMFRGPLAWVIWLVYVVGGVAFVIAVYAIWQMSVATDVLAAVKWGMASVLLFQFTVLAKTYMGTHMETNRMLLEIKRVELQVAMLRDGESEHRRG